MSSFSFRWRIALVCVVGLMMLPLLTFHLIPDKVYHQTLQGLLASPGLSMEATRLGKRFPVGLYATNLAINDTKGTLCTFDHLSLDLQLMPLLIGRVRGSINGRINTGELSGNLTVYPQKSQAASLALNSLQLEAIPGITARLGAPLQGTAQLDIRLAKFGEGMQGETRLKIVAVRLQEVQLGGVRLPDLAVPEVRGLLKIQGQTVHVENLALQGDGIYLRLNGQVPLSATTPLKATLELLPSAEFLEQQKTVFLLMLPYQTTPGSYRLPIAGTLESPQIVAGN